MTAREEYLDELRKNLSQKRYHHTICVAKKAIELAEKYGCDKEKAETAGLLHDIVKERDKAQLLQMIDEFGIIMSVADKYSHKLWHAKVAGEYIKEKFGITDTDIINAVRYHTTARADMSELEIIIYLADCISEDRDYKGLGEIRTATDIGLYNGLLTALSFFIKKFVNKRRRIHPDTLEAYNWVLTKMEE